MYSQSGVLLTSEFSYVGSMEGAKFEGKLPSWVTKHSRYLRSHMRMHKRSLSSLQEEHNFRRSITSF